MEKKKGQISAFRKKNIGEETKKKKISSAGLAMIAVIIIAAAYFVMSGYQILQLNQELEEAQKRNQALSDKKEDLMAEYNNVSSLQYIERVARRDLMLVRGNELLFIMPENTGEKKGPVLEEYSSEEGKDETDDGKTEN